MVQRPRAVIWADTGRADLDATVEYVATDSPTGALHVFDALIAAAASLSEFAERGRVMPELGRDDVREIFVFSYRVIYQVTREAVYIVGVAHGACDLRDWRLPRSS